MSAPEVDRESGSGELFLSVFPLLEFSATFWFCVAVGFFLDVLIIGRPWYARVS